MEILTSINFLQALLGGIIGYSLKNVIVYVNDVRKNRKVPQKYHNMIEKSWKHYYFNIHEDNSMKFYSNEIWQIKKTVFGNFKVKVTNGMNHVMYKGVVEYETNNLLFDLRDDDERIFLRCPIKNINENVKSPKLITFGLARDFNNRASTNATILSSSDIEIKEDEFRKILEEKFIVYPSEMLMVAK